MGCEAKPLGHRAYGSIGHLPGSRTGPADHTVEEGQAQIILEGKPGFTVTASEKLDGSCVAVVRVGDQIMALGRAGYLASSAPFDHIRQFGYWAEHRRDFFMDLLSPGQRIVGEWMNKTISIPYRILKEDWMFNAFDLMEGHRRAGFDEFGDLFQRSVRLGGRMGVVARYHVHHSLTPTPQSWLSWYEQICREGYGLMRCERPEGIVYRVERRDKGVVFLAKWVREDHEPGRHLEDEIYNQIGLPPCE